MINQFLKDEIIKYCIANEKEESCGFIIKTEKEQPLFYPCVNMHPDKVHHFIISPKDYLQAKSLGKILFLFHSHLNNDCFSQDDVFYSKYHNLNMLMYNIKSGDFHFLEV